MENGNEYRVVAGLGNPGSRYDGTRHNIGFMLLDALAEKFSVGPVAWKNRTDAALSEIRVGSQKIVLVKPLSYMNLSGEPLSQVMSFYRFDVSELVVLHDEVDLPFGSVRIKQGGGTAGHNGLKSIVKQLKSPEFTRIRLGVGKPGDAEVKRDARMEMSDWVLAKFTGDEVSVVESILSRGANAVELLCAEGLKRAQNQFNER